MDDGERLRCLREAAGFASPGEAAPVIGCSRTYLWRLENGRAPVSHVGACHLSGMAKAYGVSEATILGRVPGAEAALDSLSIIRIPVLGTIPGVDPGVLEGTVSTDNRRLELTPSQIPQPFSRDNLFALEMHDKSLIGDGIYEGDFVIVNKGKRVENGCAYVISLDGQCIVRYVHKRGKRFILQSPAGMVEAEAGRVSIIGKVLTGYRMIPVGQKVACM